jgi:hypothetical protein
VTTKQIKHATEKLARLCQEMNGQMAKSGRWFDTPHDPYVVGYGIVNGPKGPVIVSVPR